jgi:hypothetical protein
MEAQYTWTTKLFSRTFEIYRDEIKVGSLTKEGWSKKSTGRLNSREIMFVTKGFFSHETQIVDIQTEASLGNILHSPWKRKSIISLSDKEYSWQLDNFFGTKWSLANENGAIVRYQSHGFNGTIDAGTDDEILILSGFFIRNYLKQQSAEASS